MRKLETQEFDILLKATEEVVGSVFKLGQSGSMLFTAGLRQIPDECFQEAGAYSGINELLHRQWGQIKVRTV